MRRRGILLVNLGSPASTSVADVRSYLVGDMLLVRSTGIFTQTEGHLSATDEGRRLILSARQELRSINVQEMEQIVARIVGCPVLRSSSASASA